jgi:transposase
MLLVRQATTHLLSFKSLVHRQTGQSISSNRVKQLKVEQLPQRFPQLETQMMASTNLRAIEFLEEQIRAFERQAMKQLRLKPSFAVLESIPGVGKILSMTIMLETGDIQRFADAGNFVSYCRCVQSLKESNGKKKGENNAKNGNKYLSWAFIEAANFAIRYCEPARSWYQRKKSKSRAIVALKAVAAKLARAAYFMMRNQEPFHVKKAFG